MFGERASEHDLDAVRALIGDARVVAIGEGAHNITEFHILRDHIVRMLVAEFGFTAFVMESGFAEGLVVNEWIHGGPGDVEAIAREGITYRFGECEPVRQQLSWMRGWNEAREPSVSFYGMDLPGSSTSPGAAVRACLQRLPSLPGDAELIRRSELGGRTEAALAFSTMRSAEREYFLQGLRAVEARAADCDDEIVRRAAASIHAFTQELGDPVDGAYPRDLFMADTVSWVLEREQRIVVSAHNSHLRRTPLNGRETVGSLLASSLGDDLVTIGMTYGRGPEVRFTQRSPRPFDCDVSLENRVLLPNSIESRLQRLESSVSVLELQRAPLDFFEGVDGTQASGGCDRVDDFAQAYDAVVHFREVSQVPGAFERLRAEFDAARPDADHYKTGGSL